MQMISQVLAKTEQLFCSVSIFCIPTINLNDWIIQKVSAGKA